VRVTSDWSTAGAWLAELGLHRGRRGLRAGRGRRRRGRGARVEEADRERREARRGHRGPAQRGQVARSSTASCTATARARGRPARRHAGPPLRRRHAAGASGDRDVVLVDTGGFDPKSEDPIMRRVVEQTQLAIDEADVGAASSADGRAGPAGRGSRHRPMPAQERQAHHPGVNKLDGAAHDDRSATSSAWARAPSRSARRTGATSASSRRPSSAAAQLPPRWSRGRSRGPSTSPPRLDLEAGSTEPQRGARPPPIRVAVIGRPNAGKSSLVNRLLGEDRHLVSDVAGTTVDAVDSLSSGASKSTCSSTPRASGASAPSRCGWSASA
jgi:hypothetical protein